MTFAQRRNRLTTHFSERIPVVKQRISVLVTNNTVNNHFKNLQSAHAQPNIYIRACIFCEI